MIVQNNNLTIVPFTELLKEVKAEANKAVLVGNINTGYFVLIYFFDQLKPLRSFIVKTRPDVANIFVCYNSTSVDEVAPLVRLIF